MFRLRVLATSAILVVLAAGCGNDADTTQNLPEGPVETPPVVEQEPDAPEQEFIENPFKDREPVVTDDPANPPDDINGASSQDGETGILLVSYQASGASSYWATDYCHYYLQNNSWYVDLCLRHATDANGNVISDYLNLWQASNGEWQVVLQLYTGYPEYTTYRDLTNPAFNQVAWVAFPTSQGSQIDNTLVLFNGDSTWYSMGYLMSLSEASPLYVAGVPAWDPAVTVWSYFTLTNINNQLGEIPSFF